MSINTNDLKIGHTYLLKRYGNIIRSITILMITNSSIKLRWNNDNNPHISWEEKQEINNYIIIEDISDFIVSHNNGLDIAYDNDTSLQYKC